MLKQIRYMLEAALLFTVLTLSKLLPAKWASNLGGWIGRNIGARLAASRKAIKNLNAALPDANAKEITAGMWDNLGRNMMEAPHLKYLARHHTEIIGGDILEKYKDNPCILFSGHLGNWEIAPVALLLQKDHKMNPVYRAPNNPYSDALLRRSRSMNGALQTIAKSKSGTRALVKALKDNLHIGMLIDQKYNEGIEADFFNRPAMTSPVFVQLAQKFDCPLLPLRIERINGINFRVTIFPPLDIKDRSVEDVVAETHQRLEEWIKQRPEQWLWLHRRWKKNDP